MKNCLPIAFFILIASFLASYSSGQEESKPFADKILPALFNKQIQADLELVGDQKSEMQAMLDALVERKNSLGKELEVFRQEGASPDEIEKRKEEIVKGFEDDKAKTLKEAMGVLLPHQQKRLQQATAQLMMRETQKAKRIATGVLVPEVRKYLAIDDPQANRIKTKAAELQKQLAEEIKKLTEKAKAELMEELTKEQQKKYLDLVGERMD
ncbi:MAG: hypothetical protein AB8B55_08580 [Mariniblastus sp.]